MKTLINIFLVVIIPILLVTNGCERKTSTANPNLPPNTTLANIPVTDDTLFALVTLHWDGEDDDGFIEKYEYRYITRHLFRGDSVLLDWQETTSTSLTIAFESSDDLNHQIFQVRAVDNMGDRDPTPAERTFFTVKTIFPETEVLFPANNQKFFVLEEISDWWLGIQISFTSLDRDGEVVEYGWMVDGGDTTWTTDTTLFITPDKFQTPLTGKHTIKVTSRDNTNLIDPVGDSVSVNLIVPSFSRRMLVIDQTDESNFPPGVFSSNLSAKAKDDSVDNFYKRLFSPDRVWDYKANGMPPKDTLANYQLVVWHSDGRPSNVPGALPRHIEDFKDYMNVGGDFIMSGWRILKSFAWDVNFPVSFPEGSFVHDYLHIKSADETPLPGDCTGADGFGEFSDIRVDSNKLKEFPFFGKLGQVNLVTQPAGFTEAILLYKNDLDGLTWPRGFRVGLRYYGTVFDAVIFGFPLYFIVEEDARTLTEDVLRSLGY